MKILIADDEALARRRLARMLSKVPDATIVAEAGDGLEAGRLAMEHQPDVALLDIDMPGLDGLGLAKILSGISIVFTTAHADYALEAFGLAAVDYLLKPVSQARLEQALSRVPRRPVAAEAAVRVTAQSGRSTYVFEAAAISKFTADHKYTSFVLDGVQYVMDESLRSLEDRLAGSEFIRVHRSELVNLRQVRALHTSPAGAELELQDGQRARVSRRLLPTVRRRLCT